MIDSWRMLEAEAGASRHASVASIHPKNLTADFGIGTLVKIRSGCKKGIFLSFQVAKTQI